MFFYYQIVTKSLTSEKLEQETCPVCQKKGGIEVTLYMKYVSTILPLFGMGRRTGAHCRTCGHELKDPNAPLFSKQKYSAQVKEAINKIRTDYKRTWWQLLYPWSFCLIMAIAFGVGIFCALINGHSKEQRIAKYAELISNPKVGDIYKTSWDTLINSNTSGSNKTLTKLIRIEGDTMYIVRNKKSITMSYDKSEWDKLSSKPEAFELKEYKINKKRFIGEDETDRPGDFLMYNPDLNSIIKNIHIGALLDTGKMDLNFEIIERNK